EVRTNPVFRPVDEVVQVGGQVVLPPSKCLHRGLRNEVAPSERLKKITHEMGPAISKPSDDLHRNENLVSSRDLPYPKIGIDDVQSIPGTIPHRHRFSVHDLRLDEKGLDESPLQFDRSETRIREISPGVGTKEGLHELHVDGSQRKHVHAIVTTPIRIDAVVDARYPHDSPSTADESCERIRHGDEVLQVDIVAEGLPEDDDGRRQSILRVDGGTKEVMIGLHRFELSDAIVEGKDRLVIACIDDENPRF